MASSASSGSRKKSPEMATRASRPFTHLDVGGDQLAAGNLVLTVHATSLPLYLSSSVEPSACANGMPHAAGRRGVSRQRPGRDRPAGAPAAPAAGRPPAPAGCRRCPPDRPRSSATNSGEQQRRQERHGPAGGRVEAEHLALRCRRVSRARNVRDADWAGPTNRHSSRPKIQNAAGPGQEHHDDAATEQPDQRDDDDGLRARAGRRTGRRPARRARRRCWPPRRRSARCRR